MSIADGIKWWPKVEVIKYNPDTVREITKDLGHEPSGPELRWLEARHGLKADDIAYAEGNSLTTAGLARLTNLITGGGAAALTTTQSVAGVGSNAAAFALTQTKLSGDGLSTTAWYKAMDSANPTTSNGVITGNCTFGTSDGNFAWQEWCWVISAGAITAGNALTATTPGATSNQILNRAVASLGTKVAGASWTLQATITLT